MVCVLTHIPYLTILFVCICMFVGEHVCRPSLLCNPVYDKIDNNNKKNNNNDTKIYKNSSYSTNLRVPSVVDCSV